MEEMMLVPFLGQGHVFPCMQLCLHLASRGVVITVVVPSELSATFSAVGNHPLLRFAELSLPPTPSELESSPMKIFHTARMMREPFHEFLAKRVSSSGSIPACVIVDALAGWAVEICQKYGIPVVGLYTNGTCPCALDYISPRLSPEKMNPDEIVSIPGLPDSLRVTYGDLVYNTPRPPPGAAKFVGQNEGDRRQPPWIAQMEGAVAILCNTCDELERSFIDFIARETGKKVFGIGPLLPNRFWESSDSVLRDGFVRATKRGSSVREEEVEAWLDSKPLGSVIFVSFGSEVSPRLTELTELAAGLEESAQPFIWVIQQNVVRGPPQLGGSNDPPPADPVPEGFEKRVEGRGLVIRGWAPQLLILSHKSTGGFISHCGWNSTLESLALGVPILAWPIRGDQYLNAILVANHLGVGVKVRSGRGRDVTKEDIVSGVTWLIGDAEIKNRIRQVKAIFAAGFPASSSASLDNFARIFGNGSEK